MNQSTTQKMKMFATMAMFAVMANNAMAAGEVQAAMGYAYGAIMLIAVIISLIYGIMGGIKISNGQAAEGKMAILGAILIFVIPLLLLSIASKIITGYVVPVANFDF